MKNYTITVNGNVYNVTVEEGTTTGVVQAPAAAPKAAPAAPKAAAPAGAQGSVVVTAPMPGKILAVKANAGQAVKKGDVIMVLEAMKMETAITARMSGTVSEILVKEGETVKGGQLILVIK